jgi:aminoglycoside phosphotransferase family enzyme
VLYWVLWRAWNRPSGGVHFLASPGSYDGIRAPVVRIETHALVVFLVGDRAYKVERVVKYPFLDFSTFARRHEACLNELAINLRTAPQLYLQVAPVTPSRR